jgi:zona occludens toxin (predicted ATPase)
VRLPKEILVLLVLLLVMIAGVSWYVIDRRAKNRAAPPATAQPLTPKR